MLSKLAPFSSDDFIPTFPATAAVVVVTLSVVDGGWHCRTVDPVANFTAMWLGMAARLVGKVVALLTVGAGGIFAAGLGASFVVDFSTLTGFPFLTCNSLAYLRTDRPG